MIQFFHFWLQNFVISSSAQNFVSPLSFNNQVQLSSDDLQFAQFVSSIDQTRVLSICKNSPKYHLVFSQKKKSNQKLVNDRTRIPLEEQKQDPKFWSASAEWNSPRATFVNWIDKFNLMQWKMDILLLGMNSVQTRTRPSWRRIGRTTKSTSRNSSQKYSWNRRIEESSRISSRWIFGKKIDRKPRYFQGTSSVKRRNISCSTEKIENPKATHKLGCNTKQPRRWKLEQRWVKRFVWFLDRFHSVYSCGEKPPDRYMWSGERLTKRQVTSRPDHLWPEIWRRCPGIKKWRTNNSGQEKIKTQTCWKTERNLCHWFWGCRVQGHHSKRTDTFWASRALRSGHSVSSWDRYSNFGALGFRWWGSPEQIFPSDFFWSRMLAWFNTALVNWTLRIGFSMFELFCKIDEDFGGSISWDTQPNCRASCNKATAPFHSF